MTAVHTPASAAVFWLCEQVSRGRVSELQQPTESGRVGTGHVDDLHPACRSRYQGHRVRPDVKCRCHGSQGCCSGAAFHGSLVDADDKRAVMLAAYIGVG
jgi:hypothetical protein